MPNCENCGKCNGDTISWFSIMVRPNIWSSSNKDRHTKIKGNKVSISPESLLAPEKAVPHFSLQQKGLCWLFVSSS